MILGELDELDGLAAGNRREAVEEILQRRVTFQVIDKGLYRYACAAKARDTPETLRLGLNKTVQ